MEDEAITALALDTSLTRMGYSVVGPLASGEEAVRVARETPIIDLALMDIRLAGKMTGIEAAAILRHDRNIPTVYLTAYSDRETLERAEIAEASGYVVKPYEDGELRAAVETALRASAPGREQT